MSSPAAPGWITRSVLELTGMIGVEALRSVTTVPEGSVAIDSSATGEPPAGVGVTV